jgi:hypothetical protein
MEPTTRTLQVATIVKRFRMDAPVVARGELSMQHLPRSGHHTTGAHQVNDLAGRKFEMSKSFVGVDQQHSLASNQPTKRMHVDDDWQET